MYANTRALHGPTNNIYDILLTKPTVFTLVRWWRLLSIDPSRDQSFPSTTAVPSFRACRPQLPLRVYFVRVWTTRYVLIMWGSGSAKPITCEKVWSISLSYTYMRPPTKPGRKYKGPLDGHNMYVQMYFEFTIRQVALCTGWQGGAYWRRILRNNQPGLLNKQRPVRTDALWPN